MAKRKVNPQELLRDLRSGLGDTQIMRKYNVNQGQLQRLIRKMMIAGYLAESEIFQWLKLTDSQLFPAMSDTTENLLDELDGAENENVPGTDHLQGVTLVIDEDMIRYADEPVALRIQERVPVRTVGDSISRGLVRDLAEQSLRIASTDAKMFDGEKVKTLSITGELIRTEDPIVFKAKCKSRERRGERTKYYEGVFEVTHITDENLEKVRRLIEQLA
jgi:hypothetical protein